jgi:hypothetical protein
MHHLSVLPPKDPEDCEQDSMKAPTHNESTHLQYMNLLFGALKLSGSPFTHPVQTKLSKYELI